MNPLYKVATLVFKGSAFSLWPSQTTYNNVNILYPQKEANTQSINLPSDLENDVFSIVDAIKRVKETIEVIGGSHFNHSSHF